MTIDLETKQFDSQTTGRLSFHGDGRYELVLTQPLMERNDRDPFSVGYQVIKGAYNVQDDGSIVLGKSEDNECQNFHQTHTFSLTKIEGSVFETYMFTEREDRPSNFSGTTSTAIFMLLPKVFFDGVEEIPYRVIATREETRVVMQGEDVHDGLRGCFVEDLTVFEVPLASRK